MGSGFEEWARHQRTMSMNMLTLMQDAGKDFPLALVVGVLCQKPKQLKQFFNAIGLRGVSSLVPGGVVPYKCHRTIMMRNLGKN